MTVSSGVFIAHPGTQHSYQAALALQERGLLRRYFTGGLYYKKGSTIGALVRVLPEGQRRRVMRQLQRRRLDGLDERLVSSRDMMELSHKVADHLGLPPKLGFRLFQYRQARFQRHAAQMVERLRPKVVVCYDSGALGVFAAARRVGALCVLDQSIGHVTQLIRQFAAAGIDARQPEEFVNESLIEVREADVVITSSQYVVDGLVDAGVPPARIIAIPYGVDLERFFPAKVEKQSDRVRALYVGHISRRKGVSYVVDAFERVALPQLELTLLGKKIEDIALPTGDDTRLHHVSAVPQYEVAEYYRRSDFFVQMSLHESSAMTVFEALASGLPVITTPNSGSVVRDGTDGFIVQPRDVEALARRMRELTMDAGLRERMGKNARQRAEQFSWERYRERFASLLEDLTHAGQEGRVSVLAKHREKMERVLETESHGRMPSRIGAAAGNGHRSNR